jgi:hypothetical protein
VGAASLAEEFATALEGAPFALRHTGLLADAPDSDQRAFAEVSIPTVAIAGDGVPTTRPQYEPLAQLVMRIRYGIRHIAGEKPTNDGMLTPLGLVSR